MKTLAGFLLAFGLASASVGFAAQTAQVHLVCLSLRVAPGSDGFGNTLVLSSVDGAPNGELYPTSQFTYGSGFSLDNFGFPIPGALEVQLPGFTDANGNGFDDFLEVAQGVALTFTAGFYSTDISDGTIAVQWSRSPGSPTGVCVFNLVDDTFGNLGSFTHTFTVLEFTGPLTYTPGGSNVMTSLHLTQLGQPTESFQGTALFSKPIPGDFDYLLLRAGEWTNAFGLTWSYDEAEIYRDTNLTTNYYGYVVFADGDPNTSGYDYPFWLLSIDDANDTDHDTIPDFSDAPVAPPRQPLLSLTRNANQFSLTISGDTGRTYQLLENTNLLPGGWRTNQTFTLATDPQTLLLPLSNEPEKFWRVQSP